MTSTPDRYGYEHYQKRIDDLLDEINRMRMNVIMVEAQRDVAVKERELIEDQVFTGAQALTKVLQLCEGKSYVAVNDIRRAIFGNPLRMDGTFGG